MVGALLGSRYRIDAELGSGGMARVYRAVDTTIDRLVAVKLLHEHFSANALFRERFLREARAAGRLDHPNIVKVYDVGDQDGRPFLVMQLVEGPSLRDEISRLGKLSVADAVEIAAQVADALAYAHQAGILHRDVKPANILLNTRTGDRRRWALLSDFGIAQVIGEARLSSTNEVFGTVEYLAPERVAGQPAVPASDVYALGVVLYEMLTGQAPFASDDPIATALAHARQAPMPPRAINPAIPPSVEQVVMRALAKDPGLRFGSAAAFASALRAVARGGAAPTVAQPLPPPGPVDPPAWPTATDDDRGGFPVAWAALGVALALLVGTVGFVVVAARGGVPMLAAVPSPTARPAPTPTRALPTPTAVP
ncbi:MAG: serine/threonine protein kinase, partial [Dehalococcoidia bacterium]|nr:serine/threonine protein kinase [Dehalococcoidia bacterium]